MSFMAEGKSKTTFVPRQARNIWESTNFFSFLSSISGSDGKDTLFTSSGDASRDAHSGMKRGGGGGNGCRWKEKEEECLQINEASKRSGHHGVGRR